MTSNLTAPIIHYDRIRIKSDGHGIRTLVFFYGCPLRCQYCLNPHTWNGSKKGKVYSTQELLKEVEIDSLYFQATNGGITFGGGEPLLYPNFIKEFIEIAPIEWNYWIETSLSVPFENIEKIAPFISKFVVDIKTLNENTYKEYTKKSGDIVKENLMKLLALVGAEKIWVRVPYIPDYTSKEEQLETVKNLQELESKELSMVYLARMVYLEKSMFQE